MDQPEVGHDPKTDPRNRLAAGAFVAIWSAASWYSFLTNEQVIGVDFGSDPGPGLLPTLVLAILTGGSLILLGSGLCGLSQWRSSPIAWGRVARQISMPMVLALSLVGYVPIIRALGFIPGNALFAAAWMMLLASDQLRREPRRALTQIMLGTLIGVGLVYYVFVHWIGVPLR